MHVCETIIPSRRANTHMMKITVNGEAHEVAAGFTAAELIDLLELSGRRLAMEINCEILPRSQYAGHPLHEGDRIEIVQAIGGG